MLKYSYLLLKEDFFNFLYFDLLYLREFGINLNLNLVFLLFKDYVAIIANYEVIIFVSPFSINYIVSTFFKRYNNLK